MDQNTYFLFGVVIVLYKYKMNMALFIGIVVMIISTLWLVPKSFIRFINKKRF